MPLKNVCSIKSAQTSEIIEKNLISYLDYGFINIGGYFNIDLNQSGDYSDNLSSLSKVKDNRGYTYWAGPKNWIYQSGADSSGVNSPVEIYVNNSGYALGTVNYRDGHVYNIPISATSVKAVFSYKWVEVDSATSTGFGKIIRTGQNRADLDPVARSGNPEYVVTLPFVSIDIPPITEQKPYGIGGDVSPMVYKYKAKATIVSDNPNDVRRIADIIVKQEGYNIETFNPSEVVASGDEPLYFNGTLKSGKDHGQLSAEYPWTPIFIRKATGENGPSMLNGLFQAVVNLDLELLGCGCD